MKKPKKQKKTKRWWIGLWKPDMLRGYGGITTTDAYESAKLLEERQSSDCWLRVPIDVPVSQ